MVALQENSQQDKADTRLLQVDPNAGSPFSKPMGSVRVAHPALICKAASHGETAPTGSLPLDMELHCCSQGPPWCLHTFIAHLLSDRLCFTFNPLKYGIQSLLHNFLRSTDKNNLWTWSCQPQFNQSWCEAPSSLLRQIPHSEHFFSFYSFRQMYLCHYLKFHPFSQPGTR